MVIGYATHSDLDFETVKMATSVLKVALMVFFVLIIGTIILVPIALMLTLEDKEEQNSTIPRSESLNSFNTIAKSGELREIYECLLSQNQMLKKLNLKWRWRWSLLQTLHLRKNCKRELKIEESKQLLQKQSPFKPLLSRKKWIYSKLV